MFHCRQCGHGAHTRSSLYHSVKTKERYYQWANINCGETFVTMKAFVRSYLRRGK
ncbi:ogr/Delta-like zinc finger family protein [Yersinia nurmii]|uniref:Ogr/Delta-like zinc finger family protein n=1 Tax=Yersinia nurmii TaxID=685706 RepID=A0AAW7K212_9GAMM|nr:ogr/Delta-like zinc finger family protein [Yersinia nurmii]MDN0086397.1 ogr/Delta-like zinc finger family protein [Yersinia nurmii]